MRRQAVRRCHGFPVLTFLSLLYISAFLSAPDRVPSTSHDSMGHWQIVIWYTALVLFLTYFSIATTTLLILAIEGQRQLHG
ncbi:hypothetical protein B0H21DRAFT_327846 [Amylocystis lapponica]|nr:hypothetical protein B0H21DRAFT_327846 [Amylocystis lapponica]